MATARYIKLASVSLVSGNNIATILSTETDRLAIETGDLLYVEGRVPLIIDDIYSSDSNNPTTYDTIQLRHAPTYTITTSIVIISGNIRASEAIQVIEDNNQLWADNFGLFLTWSNSANNEEPLRNVDGTTSNYTTPQGLINAYNSVEKLYSLPNTNNTAQWIKMGRWNTTQSGKKLHMKIVASAGYNANANQQVVTELALNTSNGSSNNSGFYISGIAWRHGTPTGAPGIIRLVQIDTSTYDIYASFNPFTGNGSFYQVATLQTWTHEATPMGASTPPTGLEIPINTIAYV